MNRFFVVISLLAAVGVCSADEGMWLFSNLPLDRIERATGFRPDADFLDRLQKSSVRFSNGGSGSFVSPDGLVMTNHHVSFSFVDRISDAEHNYVRDGFYAVNRSDERKCADLELVQLESIEDVTSRVREAENAQSDPQAKRKARQNTIAEIEAQSLKVTGLFSEVMTFYSGGAYHLYRYKKFNDVRLVFAPEESVGYFGGETDNFEYPRYNLDVAFFRVYENGEPYRPECFLPWSENGALDGEAVFVSGHPGRTDRLNTLAHLEFLRDDYYPLFLEQVRRQELTLGLYSERGTDEARSVSSEYFRVRNTRKGRLGIELGLQTPELLDTKRHDEEALKNAWRQKYGDEVSDPWTQIEIALNAWRGMLTEYELLENDTAFNSALYKIAKKIVRYTLEAQKPDADRFAEYRSSALEAIRRSILSSTPIDPQIETVKLADSLGFYLEKLGAWERGETVEALNLVDSQSPKERARELVAGTKLLDVSYRNELLSAGIEGVKNSDDPMIRLAWQTEPVARRIRKEYESAVAEPMKDAYTRLARFRFESDPEHCYPDATFTLRLSYGKIAGYTDSDGTVISPFTEMGGAYRRANEHARAGDFALSPKWFERQENVVESTPMNLISTNDIIGGNSGSPLVNTKGEVVGLIFDGNVDSLALNFIFQERTARAVSVHSSAIREALLKIYRADRLAQEIGMKP